SEDPKGALAILDRADKLAGSTLDVGSQMEILDSRCWVYAAEQPKEALGFVEKSLATAVPEEDALTAARLRLCAGYAHERAGEPGVAVVAYETAVGEAQAIGNDAFLGRALVLRGEQRASLGRYPAALGDLKAAYEVELRRGDEGRQLYALNAIANLY